MRRALYVLILSLFSAAPAWSATFYLAWRCAKPACAQATFLLSRAQTTLPAGTTTLEQQTLPTSPASTCAKVDPEYSAGHMYCADIGCPADGLYTMYLEATAPGATFDHTNSITFGVQRCTLVDYEDLYATLQPDTSTPAPIPNEADAAPIPRDDEASPVPTGTPTTPAPSTPSTPIPPVVRPQPVATPPPTRPGTTPATTAPDPVIPRTPVRPPPDTAAPPPAPTATPGANLVTAPTTQRPWRSGSYAGTQTDTGLDTTMQRNGHAVQKLTGRGDWFGQTTSEPFSVEPGHTYDVTAMVKLQDITKLVEVDVFYWDTDGNPLTAWGEAIGGRLKGTHDWTQLRGTVTIPRTAVKAVVQGRAMSHEGTAWIDDITMQARQEPGVGLAVPLPDVAPTPAQPRLPARPAAPVPLPKPIPAQTRQGLLDQFTVLEREYQAAQQAIRSAYEATLQRLAKVQTAAAQQEREQAHTVGTKALNDLYQTLLGHWETLSKQWESVG